jgi:hypothetical protein
MVESVQGGKLRLSMTAKDLQESWKKDPASHIR